jgi:type I restriction enzyme M protein
MLNAEDIALLVDFGLVSAVLVHDFNLNIPRYVDTFEAEAVVDIAKVQQEILALENKQAELRVKMNQYLKELGLE